MLRIKNRIQLYSHEQFFDYNEDLNHIFTFSLRHYDMIERRVYHVLGEIAAAYIILYPKISWNLPP